jgi:hypothetical protein
VPLELSQDLLRELSHYPQRIQKQILHQVYAHEWEKCADDVMYWLDASQHYTSPTYPKGVPYVYTNDPHPMYQCQICQDDATYTFNKRILHLQNRHKIEIESVKELKGYFNELPGTRPFTIQPYMPPIIEAWQSETLMCIEKSRDMMATWLVVTLYTWDTLYHGNRQNIFQSEDSSKTCELVARADFIYKNQPKFLKDQHKAIFSKGSTRGGELKIETLSSEILGFPQGADQIRQYHPTGFFSDEAAFQSAAGESFSAIKPAIQNGGRYTAVSSANPSFFMHLCKDSTHIIKEG